MTRLADLVHVSRRFQRSIRIDTDLRSREALEGFLCPPSSADVLSTMARHIAETGHGAFTWTGPYGSGKSSLVVALCSALAGTSTDRKAATRILDGTLVADLSRSLPPKSKGWHILPVVGRRAALAELIGQSLETNGFAKNPAKGWNDAKVIDCITSLAAETRRTHGGVLIIVDELGKVLEGAANDGHDIFLLQQLAELCSRSERRIVFVGVLHQSFDEYAQRLAREVRDEWSKVQGRFVDLVINATGDEQIELLSRAIEVSTKANPPSDAVATVADMMRGGRPSGRRQLQSLLSKCWPLHPTVAALLGPLSRRRFGQNQRSLFAFLNSAEPHGFMHFLADAAVTDLYTADRLWDYLRVNLEPAILASPDGHRWSIGVDALDRCLAGGGTDLEVRLLKTIILVDLFRERSGLTPTADLLAHSVMPSLARRNIDKAIQALVDRSCIVYRRHTGAYALFAGSDFDVEGAIAAAMPAPDAVKLSKLQELAGLQPILAKRHYHETGAIRWFNVDFIRIEDLEAALSRAGHADGAAGRFLIAIPTNGENPTKARKLCMELIANAPSNLIVGVSDHAPHIVHLAREFMALAEIHESRPELRGDAVARREVLARLNDTQARLEIELQRMADTTSWFRAGSEPTRLTLTELNALASEISDSLYNKSPCILNELLNRDFPSSNAVRAQRDLMKRMLDSYGKPRLGLDGWPAEAGLLQSIFIETELYAEAPDGQWHFVAPTPKHDPARLAPVWQVALKQLKAKHKTSVSLSEIYEVWSRPPYGLKRGLMPLIALAIYITNQDRLAVYRNGVFQPVMSDLDVDLVTSNPEHLHFRWMEMHETAVKILDGLADLALTLDPNGRTPSASTLDIARTLVAAYDKLPAWTKRTNNLSPLATRLSTTLRYASDPNRLIFDDMPGLASPKNKGKSDVGMAVRAVRDGFEELRTAYPNMLGELETCMLVELEASKERLEDLRARASNLQKVSGDLRLEALINRLADYRGSATDIEGIASLALGKKPSDWVDADIDQAKLHIAELSQAFKRLEEIARVAGRPDTRHRMSVIVPRNGAPRAMHSDFVINAHDTDEVQDLIEKLDAALGRSTKNRQNIILAALAELSARYMVSTSNRASPKRKVG